MGKVKRQRKQWSKIDNQEVEDFLEKTTREARQGTAVEGIPDADLFYVDKGPASEVSIAASEIKLSKKLLARQKLTRAQAILAGSQTALPVIIPNKKTTAINKKKGGATLVTNKPVNQRSIIQTIQRKELKSNKKNDEKVADIWGGSKELTTSALQATVAQVIALPVSEKKKSKRLKALEPPKIAPAVEIDAPGCSFNPDRELHQDVVAEAVAAEMKKIYDKDLAPIAPLQTVDYNVDELDELEMLQVDPEDDDDDELEEEEEEDEEEDGGAKPKEMNKLRESKKTQKDRNREVRRKAEEEEQAKLKKIKKQRHELSNLKHVQAAVEETLAEREARLARRKADLAEKAANEPPRLGKFKYEPLPVQVLTTEEINEGAGSLRKLKPTAMLAKERFKSFQRRGIIEPRRKSMKTGGKKVEYIHGQRADKAAERQAAIEELKQLEAKRRRKVRRSG